MKIQKRWAAFAAAAVLAALAGAVGVRRAGRPADAASTVAATRGSIEEVVEATGSVAPLNRVEIKPPIAGRVERLLVDEGHSVKPGQILAWMSSNDRAAILDAARAKGPEELKRWEDAYKPTPIVCHFSGIVILRNAVVGQTVDASTVLFAMSDKLIVIGQVDESDIGRVKLGMPARVKLDSYPDDPVDGTVFDILYEGKNVSNVITYGVKIAPASVPPFFRSQMSANISFIVRRKDGAVLLPLAAVRSSRSGAKKVDVLGLDGKPVAREVQTGIESADFVEILSGLEAGDKVALSQARYTPQRGPQYSPFSGGGRAKGSDDFGQAPRQRKRS